MPSPICTAIGAAAIAAALALMPPALAQEADVSPEFPFEGHYVAVHGVDMHYIDEGDPDGDVILLLHGNPTWSYLWRNVIPHLPQDARIIAVDNVGFGRSDGADIAYRFVDHRRYIDGFIDAMNLEDIVLVVHDWGSALGFDYARRHADNVRGIAFMEAIVAPAMPTTYEALGPVWAPFFQAMRDPETGHQLVIVENAFIEETIPAAVMRDLDDATMDFYRAPFPTEDSRTPVLVWPNQIPIEDEPADVVEAVEAYNAWLMETDIPKLHLYAIPGALNPPAVAQWLAANVPNIETSYIGAGLHYIQEDQPTAIGLEIADWYRRLDDD